MKRPTKVQHTLLALSLWALSCSTAWAQAFVPAQGEGAVSFLYQNQLFRYHYLPTVAVDIGPIYSQSLVVDVTYGLTDKIAVSFGVPWIATRYDGTSPHPLSDFSGPNPIDDRTWHSAAQDLRFDLRYNMTRNLGNTGIVVTPYLGSIVPSHDYTYFAHSAFGRDLKELQLGVSAAKLFERGVPGLIVQARYGYGFTERVLDTSHNRSIASLEVGYFATPKLRLLALGSAQVTHGGIDLPPNARLVLPRDVFAVHDQISRDNMLNVGVGSAYSVTPAIDVFGSVMHAVAQRNGHALTRGVTLGVSWSFSTALAKGRVSGTTAANSLSKCLCDKGTK